MNYNDTIDAGLLLAKEASEDYDKIVWLKMPAEDGKPENRCCL